MNAFEMTRAKRQSRRKTEVAILNANNSDFARSEVILVDLQTKNHLVPLRNKRACLQDRRKANRDISGQVPCPTSRTDDDHIRRCCGNGFPRLKARL
jgi:hypothetical protein